MILFIESTNTPVEPSTIAARIEQLNNVITLLSADDDMAHMANIDLLGFEICIYGKDLVNDLKKFLSERANLRFKQLATFPNGIEFGSANPITFEEFKRQNKIA